MDGREGKPATERQRTPILRLGRLLGQNVEPLRVAGAEQLFPDAAAAETPLLPPGHRPERQVARPASERLGDSAHQEQVRRTGEEELPRPTTPIDLALHRVQQVRLTLYLVEGHRQAAADECLGVTPCQVHDVQVVQRQEPPASGRHLPGKGALAGLTCARDDHGRHDSETSVEAGLDETGKRDIIHDMNDIYSRSE